MPTDLPFDTHDMIAVFAIERIEALDADQATFEALYDHEEANPAGARKTILDALLERIGEGEVEEPDGGADQEPASEPGAPGSFVMATVDGQRHRAKVIEKVEALVVEFGDVAGTRALVGPDDWR